MHRPALGKYPSFGNELVLKATATGVTYLQQRKYKNRYTGSKKSAIDLDGKVWRNASDLAFVTCRKYSQNDGYRKRLHDSIRVDENGAYYLEGFSDEGKKKAASTGCSTLFDNGTALGCNRSTAISDKNATSENFSTDSGKNATNVAKVVRKKAYMINKREVRQRILAYINTQKGKKELYFWTVSFPEGTPDDVCYQAFNTWLTTLRNRQKDKFGKLMPPMLKEYLWIAERQLGQRSAPGKTPTLTIHFHIAIPHYMNVPKANTAMRTILKNLAKKGLMPGAVCNARGERYYLPSIARYNGVDICKNRNTRRVINFAIKKGARALGNYLTKYVTKNNAGVADENGNTPIPGFTHLAWHNSRGFSCLFTAVTFTIAEFTKFGFRPFLNKVRQFHMEFATFIPWLFGPPPLLMEHFYQLNSYIQTIHDGTP